MLMVFSIVIPSIVYYLSGFRLSQLKFLKASSLSALKILQIVGQDLSCCFFKFALTLKFLVFHMSRVSRLTRDLPHSVSFEKIHLSQLNLF